VTFTRAIAAAIGLAGLLWAATVLAAAPHGADEEPHAVRFIELAPLSAAILNRNRVRGLVTVYITLEILKLEEATEIQSKLPRIQSAWLNVYQRHIGRLSSPTERLDLEVMIGDLRRASDIVVGNGAVRPLIQNIQYGR